MNEKGLRWHQATPVSLCQHLHTNAACGLSRKAARSRLKISENNEEAKRKAISKIYCLIRHCF